MKFNLKYLLISCLVTLMVFIGVFVRTNYFQTIKVEFDSNSQKNFTYSIFWKENAKDAFSSAKKVDKKITAGKHHLVFYLPAEKMVKLRFCSGNRIADFVCI